MNRFELVNRTDFSTSQIKEIVNALLIGQAVPDFYLICQTLSHDGLSITNLDKPLIIITIRDLHQFARVFVHEATHLQQHALNYADEDFSERVVTDKHRSEEEKVTR